jgi:spore coat polysaccharide biosynthesis protein SpsF
LINTAIIYSRTNSKRLKNKALLNVYKKKSLIEKVVENTLKIKSIKKVILATTKSKEDKIFEKILKKHEIDFFYGSTNNLIQRTVECSKKYNFDYFLRVCGDRPIFSFSHIESIISNINRNKSFKYDLISNNKKNKLVDQGLTIEIISSRSLEKIKFKKNLTKYNLENITSYYYQNEKKFKINHIKSPKNWFLNNKYTIDNNEDLKKIRLIISKVGYNNFDIGEANRIIRKFNL